MSIDFSDLGISGKVVGAMEDMGWTEPTPIQVEAIPCGLNGTDMLAQAQTGTGKTGTYGSIILGRIPSKQNSAHALVLAPTRELALQVSEEIDKLSKYSGHTCVPIYGGASMEKQLQAIDRGTDIIIATPGRLKDHLQGNGHILDDVSIVVLDEADRMLDMGFAKDLEYILSRVPKKRQTMLFSATMSSDIKKLALRQLVNPKEIFVSKDEPVLELISQYYMTVRKEDKIDTLSYVLAKEPMKTIVFCFTKHRVDQVVRKLGKVFNMEGIHGNHSQNRRERTIKGFKEDKIDILVASDIAARGLDIDNVMRVVNMDMPVEPETYVHRIGRTGRAGKQGISVSFVMPEERNILSDIKRVTGIPVTPLDPPTGEEIWAATSDLKPIDRPRLDGKPKGESKKNNVPVKFKKMALLEINIGNADRYGKALICRFIQDNTEITKKSIGDISLGEKSTRVQIEREYVKSTIRDLSKCSVNGKPVRIDIVEPAPEDEPQRPPRGSRGPKPSVRGTSPASSGRSDTGTRRPRSPASGGNASRRPRPSANDGSNKSVSRRQSSGGRTANRSGSSGNRSEQRR